MATAPIKTATPENGVRDTTRDLEADVQQLKDDIAKLAKQLTSTGEHSYGAARRAAMEGADRLRAEGEATLEAMRANARDIEQQVMESVREKPMTALAIAAGVGFLFALLMRR
ncbi:MAG: hypothetical protein ABWZ57_19890 [Mesorhizobium sp.]|jgi:ElaB/YqjD/DUF883 family membrane-anchored ribosome-binding protein